MLAPQATVGLGSVAAVSLQQSYDQMFAAVASVTKALASAADMIQKVRAKWRDECQAWLCIRKTNR